MTVTVASFRVAFQAFKDPADYPDATIELWIAQWPKLYNAVAFDQTADMATMLFVAHVMSMTRRDVQAAQRGGSPGQSSGPVQQKAVGAVSVSYDTISGTIKDAGWYNLSSYGIQFYQLLQLAGMGGYQAIGSPIGRPSLGTWDGGNPIAPGIGGFWG